MFMSQLIEEQNRIHVMVKYMWIFLIITLTNFKVSKEYSENSAIRRKRVIGGEDAIQGKYPHAAFLYSEQSSCGATVIDPLWLVTAAHCIITKVKNDVLNLTDPSLWRVQVGSVSLKFEMNEEIYFEIQEIQVHEQFQSDNLKYDIALVKLKKPIERMIPTQIVKLPSKVAGTRWPAVGQQCYVVGWGCKSFQSGIYPTAQRLVMPIILYVQCSMTYNYENDKISEKQEFCAGYYDQSKGLCSGDSGSGLICDFRQRQYLAGIVSATSANKPGQFPAVFTRVSYFHSWIRQKMSPIK